MSRLPGNRARPVLRGDRCSNAAVLPDERWFREITDKAIRRGSFTSVDELIDAIQEFIDVHNDDPKPFVWTATADEIIEKVQRGRVALKAVTQN